MVYIWRVEHKDTSVGMYEGGGIDQANIRYTSKSCARHPSPHVDIPAWSDLEGKQRDKYFFGFSSVKQVKNWVFSRKARISLHEQGFVLRKYSVDRQYCLFGKNQTIFVKKMARVIDTVEITRI